MLLEGKKAIITGGTRGIGYAIACRFIEEGAAVTVFGSRQETADAAVEKLTAAYPEANIAAVDYDPGASEVNQLNRIKLMLAVARERS